MPQESGSVSPSLEARILIGLADREHVERIIDTGFDGALVLPRDLVVSLGLPILGGEEIELVGGLLSWADISLATVRWLGEEREAEILITESPDHLIGTELLQGTRLTIDYVGRTVSITKE